MQIQVYVWKQKHCMKAGMKGEEKRGDYPAAAGVKKTKVECSIWATHTMTFALFCLQRSL